MDFDETVGTEGGEDLILISTKLATGTDYGGQVRNCSQCYQPANGHRPCARYRFVGDR